MNLDEIKKHWENVVADFNPESKQSPTSRDVYLAELERNNIASFLRKNHRVLEIGCGDASHSLHYAKLAAELVGVDVSRGILNLAEKKAAGISNIQFQEGSALEIGDRFKPQSFDVVVSQRCLINLSQWEYQKEALVQIAHLLKPGGLFLMTEGFDENFSSLNQLRQSLGLEIMKVVDYNRNMVLKDFNDFIPEHFRVVEKRHYGTYYVLSRVYHPLAVHPESPRHDSPLNEAAMKLSLQTNPAEWGKFSYNLFFALERKV